MAKTSDYRLEGSEQLIVRLRALSVDIDKDAGTILRAAAKPIIRAAQSLVPVRTGLLKKSIGVVIRKPRGGFIKTTPFAAIGSRRGIKQQVGVTRKGKPRFANPSKYAHLVERGTKASAKHRSTRAKPFLAPAVEAAGQQALEEVRKGIVAAIARLQGGGK